MPVSENNNRYRTIAATLIFLMVLTYFCFHLLSGERGLFALLQLDKKVKETRNNLEEINAEKLKLEHKVNGLREESLDLDLLDEQARRNLGYAGENEQIYYLNKDKDSSKPVTESNPE